MTGQFQFIPLTISLALAVSSKCHGFSVQPVVVASTFRSSLDGFGSAPHQNRLYAESSDGNTNTDIFISTDLPKDETIWKAEGERIIMEAVTDCGANPDDVEIAWKSGRVVITISGASYMEAIEGGDDEDEIGIEYDDEIDADAIKEFEQDFSSDDGDDDDDAKKKPSFGSDVVSIARAINYALGEEGEGSIGNNIAVHHEIEVTTPGASDELHGIMFESYKGFNVIVEAYDKKKDKVQQIEGKLVERNDEKTIVNVKGRMRKFKNDIVQCVRLPKAKREKGVK